MADYPDHLNPFRSRGIRESFRSAKRSLIHTFRKKKDVSSDGFPRVTGATYEGTILRAHTQPRAHTANGTQRPETEVFPRSRFNERVVRAQTIAPVPKDHDATKDVTNPFTEPTNGNPINQIPGDSTRRRRQRKKRAPLPPGRENLLRVPGDHQNSQWSIASNETDCSSMAYSHSDLDLDIRESPDTLKDIHEISLGIQLLCAEENQIAQATSGDDVNHDVSAVPTTIDDKINLSCDNDEVMTEPNDVEKSKGNHVETEETNEMTGATIQKSDDAEARISLTDNTPGTSLNNEVNNNEETTINAAKDTRDCENEELSCTGPNDRISQKIVSDIEGKSCEGNCDSGETNTTSNTSTENINEKHYDNTNKFQEADEKSNVDHVNDEVIRDNQSEVTDGIIDKIDEIEYVERESIYIYGSDDCLDCSNELKFNESAMLIITGSNDHLESVDNGQPRAKLRKNKPTKSALLGCNDIPKTSVE